VDTEIHQDGTVEALIQNRNLNAACAEISNERSGNAVDSTQPKYGRIPLKSITAYAAKRRDLCV
jgi:hypothetical protein